MWQQGTVSSLGRLFVSQRRVARGTSADCTVIDSHYSYIRCLWNEQGLPLTKGPIFFTSQHPTSTRTPPAPLPRTTPLSTATRRLKSTLQTV
ncbi:unnamed protein product, partial [Iphiclides podalirius]